MKYDAQNPAMRSRGSGARIWWAADTE